MKLDDYKLFIVSVALVGSLFIASPAIAGAIQPPSGEQFSELYLLGPNQMAQNYPSNVAVGENYSIYINVGNHLGSSAYYAIYVKLGNQTDQLPNPTLGTPSPIQPLHEYQFSIPDSVNWEGPLIFSVSSASILGNKSQIDTLQINDFSANIDKPAMWNSTISEFRYQLFFELWKYNVQSNSFQFDNRFVYLNLNLTKVHF